MNHSEASRTVGVLCTLCSALRAARLVSLELQVECQMMMVRGFDVLVFWERTVHVALIGLSIFVRSFGLHTWD